MIGERLSHYRVTAQLGAGGMGEVYLAEDEKLGRKVALKVLPPGLADDPDRLKRLQREAKALAALDHPNIVTIFSVEEDAGTHFLTMAHVEGEDLDRLIPADGFPVEQLLDLAIPLVDALRAAHERGVVHRDLKPGNVMIDGEGRLRVLDFGLARVEAAAGPEDVTQLATQTMTQAGMVLGTYPYMSPEQAQGQVADARSDLFSLGVILYEMATGQRPFTGETGVSLISSILKDAPTPVTDVKAGLPKDLGAIIEKCLEKDPAERFASAEELRDRLEALRRKVRAGLAVQSPIRRFLLAGAFVAVAVLAAVVGWQAFTRDGLPSEAALLQVAAPRIASLAVLPLRNFSGDPEQQYFVDGMTEALITDLSKIGALKVISRTSAMQYRDSVKTLTQIAEELDVEAVIEGSVLREGNRVGITAQLIEVATDQTLWADRYERDLTSILALQGEIAKAIAGEIQVTLTPEEETLLSSAREVDPEAYDAYLNARFHNYKLTPADLDIAMGYLETALAKEPDFALAHVGVAAVWGGRRQMGLASKEAAVKAFEALHRALALDQELGEAHMALASMQTWGAWNWVEAEKSFLRALELDPNSADARASYSHFLNIMGRPNEAMEQIEKAIALDPLNPFFRGLYGVDLVFVRRYDEAIEQFERALATSPNLPFVLDSLSQTLWLQGRLEESYEMRRRGLLARGRTAAAEAFDEGYREGGFAVGARRAAESLALDPTTATSNPVAIARLYLTADDAEAALDWLERGVEARDPGVTYLGMPFFDSMAGDPRFQRLLERVGLPQRETVAGAEAPGTIRSIAVLPLRNLSGDPEQEYFADGMTEALITDLSKIGALKVIARSSAMRFKGSEAPPSEIALSLGVDAVVEGSVMREGDEVGISAQLIETSSEEILWGEQYTRNLTSILALQAEIATAIAAEIQVTLTPQEQTLLSDKHEVDPRVYDAYLKAHFHLQNHTPDDLDAASRYLELALEHDPEFALAHAGVSRLWTHRRQMGLVLSAEATPKAIAAARKAIDLDPDLAEAHNALAGAIAWGEWDWKAGEESKRKAIALDPSNAGFRSGFSHLLMLNGRWTEAEEQITRAVELDPLNAMVRSFYGIFLHADRRPDEAIEQFQRVLQTVPNHGLALSGLWEAFRVKGQYDEAIQAAVGNLRARGNSEAAEVLFQNYRDGEYTQALKRLAEYLEAGPRKPILLMRLYATAGDKENTLHWMERAYEVRNPNLPYASVMPAFDFLRDEPRFRDLLGRMNLPVEEREQRARE